MKIERVWAMPNKWTFRIKPIAKLLREEMIGDYWIDPFYGVSEWPIKFTNDLSPEIKADSHIDALEYLSKFETAIADGIIFDPPYSLRQITECYKNVGIKVNSQTTQSKWHTKLRREISRVVKPGGKVISCAWNSNGIGKTLGFKKERILLVAHGGSHNDTIVTVERKMNGSLF